MYRATVAAAAAGLLGAVSDVRGQDAAPLGTVPDKSGYWLFNPVPRNLMREMSTDRPDTTESPHTVDAGHLQLELSFIDWTYDRRSEGDVTTRSMALAPLLLKIGLLNNVDVQIGLDPHTRTKTTDRATGDSEVADGFGDTLVRLKVNLWGNDAPDERFGGTSLAIMPFVSFPTATDGVGAGHTQWGVIVPMGLELGGGFDLGTMIEFDVNRSEQDDRTVVDFVHTVTIGHALAGDLNGYIEYAGFANLNHDEKYRGYFDLGLTYGLTEDVQLDAGARVGLTKASDDLGLFVGVSLRF